MQERIMKACEFDADDPVQLEIVKRHLPFYASFKLDGIHGVNVGGTLLSASMKPIPNKHTRQKFSTSKLVGLDGELILGKPTDPLCYRNTNSAVMSRDGSPDVKWYVYDRYSTTDDATDRLGSLSRLSALGLTSGIIILRQQLCSTWEEVLAFEKDALAQGYEGVILRSPYSPYKEGRATLKEGYLIKLKRFKDSEAEVLGMVELQHNMNVAMTSETGLTKRSSCKAGKVPAGTMGALQVRDIHTGVEFELGGGFTAEDRDWWWRHRNISTSKLPLAKYKYFPVGGYDKPRHPTYLGLRMREDVEEPKPKTKAKLKTTIRR